jgi:hypothetical protein
MAILRAYRYRILQFVILGLTLASAISSLGRGEKYHGSALLDFEMLSAMIGAFTGLSIGTLFRSYVSNLVPHHKRIHLGIAFGLQVLTIAAIVATAARIGDDSVWGNVSYLDMAALYWAWSLIWFCGGVYGRNGLIVTAALNLLLTGFSWKHWLSGVHEALWLLMQRQHFTFGPSFLIADTLFVLFLWRRLSRTRQEKEEPATLPLSLQAPSTLEEIPELVGDGLGARMRHLRNSLPRDYWILSLALTIVVFIWGRYRGIWGTVPGGYPIYPWCFMAALFMIPANALKRNRVQILFGLPLSRREIVTSYGVGLLSLCIRNWLGFVVVTFFAFQIPLPTAEPTNLPLETWLYCLAIFLIMFGLRTLLGSWDDSFRLRVIATLIIVEYASASDWIPMRPEGAMFIGLGLIAASYLRWNTLELR